MAFDSHQYRDPMLVLEAKQMREARFAKKSGCMGCVHKSELWGMAYCKLSNTKPGIVNMRRCGQYQNTGAR